MEIDIQKITVMIRDIGTDQITINTNMSNPFPSEISDSNLVLEFEAPKGTGIDYVRNNFNIEPDIIDTTKKTN
jgi:hypothetical protein